LLTVLLCAAVGEALRRVPYIKHLVSI